MFAWSQCRLSIPGWFGVGSALTEVSTDVGVDAITGVYERSPFFQSVVSNMAMVLAKVDLEIADHYVTNLASDIEHARHVMARLRDDHRDALRWCQFSPGQKTFSATTRCWLAVSRTDSRILIRSTCCRSRCCSGYACRRRRRIGCRGLQLTLNAIATGLRNSAESCFATADGILLYMLIVNALLGGAT